MIDRERRRPFRGVLILALVFRILAFFIVGLAALLVVVALMVGLITGKADTVLGFLGALGGAIAYGVGLFIASELIRLLVGIAKDVRRVAEASRGGSLNVMALEARDEEEKAKG
jgi:uncharacterized membrane protein